MIDWCIHHKTETASTNLDARGGVHGDVFTADYQTAGRGRLAHKWLSPPKTNLMMSVVLSVEGLAPEQVATLPLVVGLAVCKTLSANCQLKWPNDILIGGKKVAGILCERQGDCVIAGIGINVKKQRFPDEIANKAIALGLDSIEEVRDSVLLELSKAYEQWKTAGFSTVYPSIAAVDFLKGREIAVRQTDNDAAPIAGVCGGIQPDGALDVGGVKVYAGEVHVFLGPLAVSVKI